ncbi:MAG: fluoride efflux transporter CrcB [Desulfovibrio sp.]|uniref:fluoride efflux transporter CrcB n=1 Tax=Desulfovibrio sp. TaxID=885 RepID=UPI0025859A9B|nr:fluoride efflux transporter CrcB [Desulfovibrio sp.]MCD7983888.1 fluoride efflux transporter CrcB [Desulfovibrio sp.]
MISSLLAICAGASAGAVLRWLLGLALNPLFPTVPLGTLAANWLGGYIIGLAISLFAFFPFLGAEWRLLVVTGFLGALTTFSTFSAEVATLIQEGRLLWAGGAVALHVCGSLFMTFLGMGTFALIRYFWGVWR